MPERSGVVRLDLHGKNRFQARTMLEACLRRAGRDVYRVVVIHGYHGGVELRDLVRQELACHPRVLRMEQGCNPGETVLVLREWY